MASASLPSRVLGADGRVRQIGSCSRTHNFQTHGTALITLGDVLSTIRIRRHVQASSEPIEREKTQLPASCALEVRGPARAPRVGELI